MKKLFASLVAVVAAACGLSAFGAIPASIDYSSSPKYSDWAYANTILNWRGTSSQHFHASTVSALNADGTEGTTYTLNSDISWNDCFGNTSNKFVLRYDKTGYKQQSDAQFDPLTLGGLIVESYADDANTAYCIYGNLAGKRRTLLGFDGVSTLFKISKPFAINRNSNTTIRGAVTIDVDYAGESLDLCSNQSSYSTVVTSGSTLVMKGKGTVKVATLTNNGTMDFTEIADRTTDPFITGNLTIGMGATLKFAAGTTVSSYKLCTGTLSGANVATVIVGDNTYEDVAISYDNESKTISFEQTIDYTATIDGEYAFEDIVWDGGKTITDPGVAVVTINGTGTVTGCDKSLASITVADGITLDCSYIPSATTITAKNRLYTDNLPTTGGVPSGYTYTVAIDDEYEHEIAGAIAGTLNVNDGTIKVTPGDRGISGTINVAAGATLVNGTNDGLNYNGNGYVNVYGTLSMGATRWTVGGGNRVRLYGATVTGAGQSGYSSALDFIGATTMLEAYPSADGTVMASSVSSPIRMRNSGAKIWVTEGCTLTLSGAVGSASGEDSGITKVGSGTLTISGASTVAAMTKSAGAFYYSGTSLTGTTLDGVVLTGSARVSTSGTVTIKNMAANDLTGGQYGYAFIGSGTISFEGENILDTKSDGSQNKYSKLGYGSGNTVVIKANASLKTGGIVNSTTAGKNGDVTIEAGATLTTSDITETTFGSYIGTLTNNGTANMGGTVSLVTLVNGGTLNLTKSTTVSTSASGDGVVVLKAADANITVPTDSAITVTTDVEGKAVTTTKSSAGIKYALADAVASIGDKNYATLVEALAAVQPGETVTLKAAATGTLTVTSSITIADDSGYLDTVDEISVAADTTLTLTPTGSGNKTLKVRGSDSETSRVKIVTGYGMGLVSGSWFRTITLETSTGIAKDIFLEQRSDNDVLLDKTVNLVVGGNGWTVIDGGEDGYTTTMTVKTVSGTGTIPCGESGAGYGRATLLVSETSTSTDFGTIEAPVKLANGVSLTIKNQKTNIAAVDADYEIEETIDTEAGTYTYTSVKAPTMYTVTFEKGGAVSYYLDPETRQDYEATCSIEAGKTLNVYVGLNDDYDWETLHVYANGTTELTYDTENGYHYLAEVSGNVTITATADKKVIEPVAPGEDTECKTVEEATEAAKKINNDKGSYIKVPACCESYRTAYLDLFEATASGKIVKVDFTADAVTTLTGEADTAVKNDDIADPTATTAKISARAGLYYTIAGCKALTTFETEGVNGTSVQAEGSTVTLTKPTAEAIGATGAAFYKVRVSAKALQ